MHSFLREASRSFRAISICEMRLILLFCGRRRTHTPATVGSVRPFLTLLSARRLLRIPQPLVLSLPGAHSACGRFIHPHIRLFFHASAYILSPPAERDGERERPKPQTLFAPAVNLNNACVRLYCCKCDHTLVLFRVSVSDCEAESENHPGGSGKNGKVVGGFV